MLLLGVGDGIALLILENLVVAFGAKRNAFRISGEILDVCNHLSALFAYSY